MTTKTQVALTDKQLDFIVDMCETWVPSTQRAMTTKWQDKITDGIVRAIKEARKCGENGGESVDS